MLGNVILFQAQGSGLNSSGGREEPPEIKVVVFPLDHNICSQKPQFLSNKIKEFQSNWPQSLRHVVGDL